MIFLKRFIDKMAVMESRQNKDIVLTMSDARGLRDEIVKLLADFHELQQNKVTQEEIIKVDIKGGSFF